MQTARPEASLADGLLGALGIAMLVADVGDGAFGVASVAGLVVVALALSSFRAAGSER